MSPVEPFFDSRKKYPGLPLDGDANGAYNIARKGIFMLNTLNNSENPEKENLNVSKKDWQNFAQADETVKRQKAKMK
jgi:CRISPR-associated protein Cpf1